MKRITLITLFLTVLLTGCNSRNNNVEGWLNDSVAFKKQIADNFGFELVDQNECEWGWHLWRNNDGITYWDSTGYGPCNEKVVVRDAQGRIIVVAGRASECSFFHALKYIYSEDGDLTGFVTFGGDADFGFVEPPLEYKYSVPILDARYYRWPYECFQETENPYSISVEVVDLALTTNYDAPYYLRFYFDRNEDGQIVSVYDPKYHLRYKAPYNGYIEYIVKETIFGGSDIECDKIKLLFLTRPINPDDRYFSPDTIIWYSDYSKYREMNYPVI